jgi:hypothetical protein
MLPIMPSMRHRAITLALCTAALSLLASAPASAASTTFTTNGGATSVTATTATLNGSFQVTHADSAWVFQYGPTTSYGHYTAPQTVQPGFHAVSAQVTNLTPGTTYHFRLVVYQETTTDSPYNLSDDKSLTTLTTSGGNPPGKKSPGYGTASLRSRSLLVHKGTVAVPLRCAGKSGAFCRGLLTVRTSTKQGGIRCGGTSFSLRAGSTRTLHPRASSGCAALLAVAKRHRVSGTLQATFTTHQASQSLPVTLHQ